MKLSTVAKIFVAGVAVKKATNVLQNHNERLRIARSEPKQLPDDIRGDGDVSGEDTLSNGDVQGPVSSFLMRHLDRVVASRRALRVSNGGQQESSIVSRMDIEDDAQNDKRWFSLDPETQNKKINEATQQATKTIGRREPVTPSITGPITSFTKENRWLSNFHEVEVMFEGYTYASTEHAYQAAKTLDLEERELFRKPGLRPGEAKKMGTVLALRDDWDEVRFDIMRDLNEQKYQTPDLKEKLLATGDRDLIEGNNWHDCFWGSCICDNCDGKGQNNLGKILMAIRDDLRK